MLFLEHRAWFSCDALGLDGRTSDDDVRDSYRRLGTLFAELLDENCLMIFLPDLARGFPINEDTEMALRSPDPVRALRETLTLPIIAVPDDDPLIKRAVDQVRENWPTFVAAFEEAAGENFSVKRRSRARGTRSSSGSPSRGSRASASTVSWAMILDALDRYDWARRSRS